MKLFYSSMTSLRIILKAAQVILTHAMKNMPIKRMNFIKNMGAIFELLDYNNHNIIIVNKKILLYFNYEFN